MERSYRPTAYLGFGRVYFNIAASDAPEPLSPHGVRSWRTIHWGLSMLRARMVKILLQHGVIPGSCHTKAQGISSPGTHEATLMWPRNDGELRWNIMSDWTCR